MKFNLNGRWAIVTGASAGIGRAIAEELAARGCHLSLAARREDRLAEIAANLSAKHGVQTTTHPMDLSLPGAAEKLAGALESRPISVLVNNAGFGMTGRYAGADDATVANMLDLNVKFLAEFTRRMLPGLQAREDGARILNVGSVAGFQGVPFFAAYAASKAFVNGFSQGLAWELRGSAVGVTCLAPGQTESEFLDVADMRDAGIARSGVMDAVAVARAGVKAMIAGRETVVPGWLNWARVTASRFAPRAIVRWTITRMFRDLA